MKTNLLSILSFISITCSIETTAQTIITNGGFEQWTTGHPDNWTSFDFLDITQTTDKANGIYAAKLEDITSDGHVYMTNTSLLGAGEHPSYASFNFKFGNFIGNEYATITVSLIDASGQEVAVATQNITTYLTTYTPLTLSFSALTYTYIPNPTKIKIEITFESASGSGSQFFVDDFGYGGNALGINNVSIKSGLEIYPNPSNGKFTLKNENKSAIKSIEIFNILGESVYTLSNIKIQNEIDISYFPKGIYFVNIFDGEKIYTEKIVIQ